MNNISWDIKVPIFKDRIILKQLGLAVGIPFGILILVLIMVKAYQGLLMIGALFLLSYILVMLVFRGTYDVHFAIDEKGVLSESQPKQSAIVKKLSTLTMILGLFSQNTTTVGAGMLASSRTRILVPWNRLEKVKYIEKDRSIMLYAGFGENMALFCTDENFDQVKSIVAEKMEARKH